MSISPKMDDWEVHLLTWIFKTLKPNSVLEWGSGFSTTYFPEVCPEIGNWYSMEHQPTWFQKAETLRKVKKLENRVIIILQEDKLEYVNFYQGNFDFILVDGANRCACITRSWDLITQNGIVCIHDANTDKYWEDCYSFPPFPEFHFFMEPEFPTSKPGWRGLGFFSKTRDLDQFFEEFE